MSPPTVEAARRALTTRFRSAAIESAELDARILTSHALGLDLTGLISAAQRRLTPNLQRGVDAREETLKSGLLVA